MDLEVQVVEESSEQSAYRLDVLFGFLLADFEIITLTLNNTVQESVQELNVVFLNNFTCRHLPKVMVYVTFDQK